MRTIEQISATCSNVIFIEKGQGYLNKLSCEELALLCRRFKCGAGEVEAECIKHFGWMTNEEWQKMAEEECGTIY